MRHIVLIAALLAATAPVGCGGSKAEPEPVAELAADLPPIPAVTREGFWIVAPDDGARVEHRTYFTGTVSDTAVDEVWLVVHAIGGDGYWVQPQVLLRPDGAWLCQPYIGLPETPSGATFEVRAFANPAAPLEPGAQLQT